MKKIFQIILSVAVFTCSNAFSAPKDTVDMKQVESTLDSVSNDFVAMKEKINQLLDENKELESEYARLNEELSQLEFQAVEKKSEVQKIKGDINIRRANDALDQKEITLKKQEENLLILESKNSYLTKELLELQDTQPARKLQLEDLQYKKKSLEMEAKLKEFTLQQSRSKREKELSALNQELKAVLDQNKELSDGIQKDSLKKSDISSQIEKIKSENAELETKLSALSSQKELKQKEIELLKMKKMYLTRSMEDELWPKEKEKADLKEKMAQLQSRLDELNKKLDVSLSTQQKNRKLTEELIQIDSDNQALRGKITQLKSKEE